MPIVEFVSALDFNRLGHAESACYFEKLRGILRKCATAQEGCKHF